MRINPLPWLLGRWLRTELPRWREAGVIQPDQEQRILGQLDATCCGIDPAQCGKLSLRVLAAAALGLALILVVCELWPFIPFSVQLVVPVVFMAAAHCGGYWQRFRHGQVLRGNSLFVLGTLLFGGAVLVVVGSEHAAALYPWALFLWAAGTLPLALVLGSLRLLVLANLLAAAWFVAQMLADDGANLVSLYLIVALCSIHWANTNRSRGLLILVLSLLVVWWLMVPVAQDFGRKGWYWCAGIGPLLWLAGKRHDESNSFGAVYKNFGRALATIGLLPLSMPSVAANLVKVDLARVDDKLPYWLTVVALLGLVVVFAPAARRFEFRRDWRPLAALAAITLLPASLGALSQRLPDHMPTIAIVSLATVFSAAAVAAGSGLILCGASRNRTECIACGGVYLIVWAALLCGDLADRLSTAALAMTAAGAAILMLARIGRFWRKSNHETVSAENA